MMRSRNVPALTIAATAFASFALGGCSKPDDGEVPAQASHEEVSAIPVHAAKIETAPFSDRIRLYGRLEARESVRISAELGGRIEGLPFDEGQRVGRGQTVARINARIARAQVKQAKAGYDLAAAERDRVAKLVAKKLATSQQLLSAKAQAEQAAAGLELAQANLDKAVIRAPISGLVTNVAGKKGELAGPGVPLLEIVDLSEVEVAADVPERDVPLLQTGSEVEVTIEAFPGERFAGVIQEIGLVANSVTRTFPIKIRIANKDGELRPGMLASLNLVRQSFEDVVVIPRDAVIDDVDTKTVYVVENNTARLRPVTLGPTRGRFAVVRSGIEPGEVLIVLGHREVVDGQAITVSMKPPCCKSQLAPVARVGGEGAAVATEGSAL